MMDKLLKMQDLQLNFIPNICSLGILEAFEIRGKMVGNMLNASNYQISKPLLTERQFTK